MTRHTSCVRPGAALAGLLVLLAGCSSAPKAPDRTDGTSIELTVRDTSEGLSAAYYAVGTDGSIGWGGGFAGADGEVTWSGTMTDAQCARFVELVTEDGWLVKNGIASTGQPSTRTADAKVRQDGRVVTHRLRGSSPALDRMEALLEEASLSRLDAYMKTLPQASDAP